MGLSPALNEVNLGFHLVQSVVKPGFHSVPVDPEHPRLGAGGTSVTESHSWARGADRDHQAKRIET